MPNTYTQIHLHIIFAPRFREALINPEWEENLYKYITGIVQNHKHKMLAINSMPDHIHLLVGLNPSQAISDLLRDIKGDSSLWINEKKFTKKKFEWQSGYSAFSYSKSQIPKVIDYIKNQKEHHKKHTFLDEYKKMLELFEVDFNEQYIFKEPE